MTQALNRETFEKEHAALFASLKTEFMAAGASQERDRIQAVRAAGSRMIHQRLHKAMTLLAKRRILPKSNLGKAIHYALHQWP